MKKKIALLLALALCLSMLAGMTVAAEGETAPKIAYYTVPMRATVCILYAVSADSYDGVAVKVTKSGSSVAEDAVCKGLSEINGKEYLIFEYELAASEMSTKVEAYATNGTQNSEPVTYSVNEFLDNYVESYRSVEAKAKFVKLAQAMKAYGEAISAWKNQGGD